MLISKPTQLKVVPIILLVNFSLYGEWRDKHQIHITFLSKYNWFLSSALISSLSETGAVGHGELAGGALQAGQGDGVHVGGGGGHRGLRQPVQQVLPLPLSRVIV